MPKYDLCFETETIRMHCGVNKNDYWLWDETRKMNLAMRAESEREAFIEALEYYQRRLTEVEEKYKELNQKVQNFLQQFDTENED